MTMNMPATYQPPYNRYEQQPSYSAQNSYSQGGMVNQSRQPGQYVSMQNAIRPGLQATRGMSANNVRQYTPSQSFNPVQGRQNIHTTTGGQFVNRPIGAQYDEFSARENMFVRSPNKGQQPRYVSPQGVGQPVYAPQQEMYPNYQQQQQPYQTYYTPQQPQPQPQIYQQPYIPASYQQPPIAQNFIPLYTPPYQTYDFTMMGQRRNLPQQSLNSNFNYENANFDCNYTVQENMVHCVICNQTYRANQKKEHLELHREKARNVNIRAVDEEQLRRLDKYNAMLKPKGLIVKPIVQPDEFNVQYNPNEFVLRKVTQYKDTDVPHKNDPHALKYSSPQEIGFNEPRRSEVSSPQRQSQQQQQHQQSMRQSQNNNPSVLPQNARNTNTRFNSQSIRQEQRIFLSDRFDHHQPEGQSFNNSNYNPKNSIGGESSRRESGVGNDNKVPGYRASDMGYEKGLQEIKEEDHRLEGQEIPINKIVGDVSRDSGY